jgi:hypothetical protein
MSETAKIAGSSKPVPYELRQSVAAARLSDAETRSHIGTQRGVGDKAGLAKLIESCLTFT